MIKIGKKKKWKVRMVVLNDVGLTLEIIGFGVFLFVPLQETYNLILGGKRRIPDFINKHTKIRYGLRYGGIVLIVIGLVMQYSFLN